MGYTLIAAEVSLFSGKARAYLRYKGLDFTEQHANRHVLQTIVKPKTGMTMIPVLLLEDETAVQDTTCIMDVLEARHPTPSVVPRDPVLGLASRLLELYGDEWLVLPAMHYRWHYKRNMPLVLREFGDIAAPKLPKPLRSAAGLTIAAYFGGNYGRALGIGKQNRAAIERSYEAFLDDFDRHLASHPFLLGARPCEGDFGFMGPLYAHLYRDPAPGKLMRSRAPNVASWVERMNDPKPGDVGWAPTVPGTLDPIFARMFREQWPVVEDTFAAVHRWVRDNPGAKRIKRFVGEHQYQIEGAQRSRWIQSFTQWMAQRPLDIYRSLEGDDKTRADVWLRRVGGYRAMQLEIRTRVERQADNRLAAVAP